LSRLRRQLLSIAYRADRKRARHAARLARVVGHARRDGDRCLARWHAERAARDPARRRGDAAVSTVIQRAAGNVEGWGQICAGRDDGPVPAPKVHVEGELETGEVPVAAGGGPELAPITNESHRLGDPVTVLV